MPEQKTIQQALEIALSRGLKFAEVFAEQKTVFSAGLDNGKLERIRSGLDTGCGFRIIDGGKTYYGFVNSLSAQDILDLAERISGLASRAGKKQTVDFTQKNIAPRTLSLSLSGLRSKGASDTSEKINLLTAAEKTARKIKNISQVTTRWTESCQKILVANTDGVWSEDTRLRRRFFVQCIAGAKGDLQTGYESVGFTGNNENFLPEQAGALAETAADRAVALLSAEQAPAGTMTVVLGGEAGGTMVHEACGHALEADFIAKKTSIFTDTFGTRMFPACITIVDDGTISGLYGTNFCDDEGTLCRRNVLIDRGRVTGFMNDRLYARELKMPLSGNARRESYRYAPMPRMTNTYLDKGTDDPAAIIASVDNGIFVKKLGGGQVDVTNGNFVFEVTEGYLLRNGKIGRLVRGATLVGSGIEVLKSIDMVGGDLHFIPGMCGKGQTAPVSDGQPTVRIPALIVGGQK